MKIIDIVNDRMSKESVLMASEIIDKEVRRLQKVGN